MLVLALVLDGHSDGLNRFAGEGTGLRDGGPGGRGRWAVCGGVLWEDWY